MHANMKMVIANLLWNCFFAGMMSLYFCLSYMKKHKAEKNLIQLSSPSPLPKLAHPNKLTRAPRVCVSSEKK